jgi:methionyl-tRNA formyltransferase
MKSSRKIVFLGMHGRYSYIPFKMMLDAGVNIEGVITPRPSADSIGPVRHPYFPPPEGKLILDNAGNTPTLGSEAGRHGIPLFGVGNLNDPRSLAVLRELDPDLIITACFSRILPISWLAIPKQGCLNLHPSLLPAYRGPTPQYWQHYYGENTTGVTLHFMDQEIDTGAIVNSIQVKIQDGATGVEVDEILSKAGGGLILRALALDEIPRREQENVEASYQPYPSAEERKLPVSWPVKRAYNFLRGADQFGPFRVVGLDKRETVVREALAYLEGEFPESNEWIAFSDGSIKIR